MKIQNEGRTLNVSEILELTAVNSATFRDEVSAALRAFPTVIEVDLSKTQFLDSSGLGALFSLYQAGMVSDIPVRLLNPTPEVRQLLELTQMQQLFEIVPR